MTPQQFAAKHSNFLKSAETFEQNGIHHFVFYAKGTLIISSILQPDIAEQDRERLLYEPLLQKMKEADRAQFQLLEQSVLGIWKNLKHGNYYAVTELRKDCTNNREGSYNVMYQNTDGEKFSRELNEFRAKFLRISSL